MAMNSRQIADELLLRTQTTVRRAAISIAVRVIEGTPIDTGWAVTNWIMSAGSPWRLTVGSKQSISPSVQEASISRIQTYNLRQGRIYISNNVPYIVELNEGTSRQAPSGFIQAAILTGLLSVGQTPRVFAR